MQIAWNLIAIPFCAQAPRVFGAPCHQMPSSPSKSKLNTLLAMTSKACEQGVLQTVASALGQSCALDFYSSKVDAALQLAQSAMLALLESLDAGSCFPC
jgi:hypothetical protein